MARDDHLGDLEELVLLAVMRLEGEAYGAAIRRALKQRARRAVSVSTIYVTLMRLQEKGLVDSWLAEPTAVRGGKAKRHFRLTPEGVESLRAERAAMERMWEGLDELALPGAGGPGRSAPGRSDD